MTKFWTTMLACASLLVVSNFALAKNDGDKMGSPSHGAQGQAHGHKHAHLNGHNLLGDKIKHDGKHELGRLADRVVTADVKNGKVDSMAAGDLPVKRVKTNKKMAELENGIIPAAWDGGHQLAQYDETYYGYCFDDGYNYTCYWYAASDVNYADYVWVTYDPYY